MDIGDLLLCIPLMLWPRNQRHWEVCSQIHTKRRGIVPFKYIDVRFWKALTLMSHKCRHSRGICFLLCDRQRTWHSRQRNLSFEQDVHNLITQRSQMSCPIIPKFDLGVSRSHAAHQSCTSASKLSCPQWWLIAPTSQTALSHCSNILTTRQNG